MYLLLGILGGVSNVFSRMINATLTDKTDNYQCTFYNYLTGLLTAVLVLLIVRDDFPAKLGPDSSLQSLMYLGGCFGLIAVVIANIIAHRMPAVLMTFLIFISQLFTGIVLDYWISGIFSAGKVIGGVVILIGLAIYQSPSFTKTKPQKP